MRLLKFHLMRAQNRMKQQADKHRSDRNFALGDFVYLKLQPYRQFSMSKNAFHKLLPKYYGPFKVIDKFGAAAYQLELPSDSAIHNVFHTSQLKLCPDPMNVPVQFLPSHTTAHYPRGEPEAILDRKMVKRGRLPATKVLIKWKNSPEELATWEFYHDVLTAFPQFHL